MFLPRRVKSTGIPLIALIIPIRVRNSGCPVVQDNQK